MSDHLSAAAKVIAEAIKREWNSYSAQIEARATERVAESETRLSKAFDDLLFRVEVESDGFTKKLRELGEGAQQTTMRVDGLLHAVGELKDSLLRRGADHSDLRKKVVEIEDATCIRTRAGRLVSRASGQVQGQHYADAVADDARDRAAKVLDEDVVAVLEAIDAGESYEDIRARLVDTYKGMSPDNLAKLTEAAITMAELGGRHAINEDT